MGEVEMLYIAKNALALARIVGELGEPPVLAFQFAELIEQAGTVGGIEAAMKRVRSNQAVLFEWVSPANEGELAVLRALVDYAQQRDFHVIFLVAELDSIFQMIQPMVMLGRALVYDERGEDRVYAASVLGPNTLYVQMFGYPLVYYNGRRITQWDGTLPRHLFYYFVDHPMVTRDEIFAVFWPTMSVKEATNVFHVTKRKISERLGHELTKYTGGFYIPHPDLTVINPLTDFEAAIAVAREGSKPQYWLKWYEAASLYRGPFLDRDDCDLPWMVERREQLVSDYATACNQWALVLLKRGEVWPELQGVDRLRTACNWFVRAFAANPVREDSVLEALYLMRQLDDKEGAVDLFKKLTDFLRTIGMRPAPLHVKEYAAIMAKK